MQVEMTGYEDRQGPWKLALCGPAGVGKTMFSSTARSPLFVFFQQEPRIKSIAGRSVPHVKLVNDFTSGQYVLQQLESLLIHLKLMDHSYDTLVIDTGDELFQAMKAARSFQNGGEFGPGDWGWIGDTYREVMLSIIDLPMNVIVTYHTKLSQDEDGTYRELLLQGSAKDEAPGWFDIVGALDTFETVDDSGSSLTRRVLLTSSSRSYPWVKDHSGALPGRFFLSDGIVDDFPRLLEVVQEQPETVVAKEVLEEIPSEPRVEVSSGAAVPSPEALQQKKEAVNEIHEQAPQVSEPVATDHTPAKPETENSGSPMGAGSPVLPEAEAIQPQPSEAPQTEVEAGVKDGPTEPQPEETDNTLEPSAGESSGDTAAEELLEEQLNTEEVFVCAECGTDVTDGDLRDLAQIRFRQYLCRDHFKARTR